MPHYSSSGSPSLNQPESEHSVSDRVAYIPVKTKWEKGAAPHFESSTPDRTEQLTSLKPDCPGVGHNWECPFSQ